MKRSVAFILCFVMLFSLSSCNIYEKISSVFSSSESVTEQEGTTAKSDEATAEPESTATGPESTTPEPAETAPAPEDKNDAPASEIEIDPFKYYYAIVDAYRVATKRFDLLVADDITLMRELMLENKQQAQSFRVILSTVYDFYPYDDKKENITTPEKLTYYRYDDRTDINGDGFPELVLLSENYEILAIYSYSTHSARSTGSGNVWYVNSDPVLLATFSPQNGTWIDGAGRIHVCYLPRNSTYKVHKVYEIAQGGTGLNQIVEYGQRADEYFVAYGEKEKTISTKEFAELQDQYGDYHNPKEAAAINREQSGLYLFKLYSSQRKDMSEAMYRPVLNGEKPVLVEKTGQTLYLGDYVPTADGVPLSQCEVLRYVYYDVDNDDVYETVIDSGDAQFILVYEKGLVTLKEISNEKWKEIERDEFLPICPLGAPWRERIFSREEIHDIASNIWGILDGDEDAALGKLYVYYIIVSDEADEDGYYLVTWRSEIYGYCYEDVCSETDPNHRHLYRVEDHRYMLIHERTGVYFENARVSLEGAKRYASAYWGIADGTVIHGLGRTFVVRVDTTDNVGYANVRYNAYLRVECYSTITYEHGGQPLEIKNIDFVYIGKHDGVTYLWPGYIIGK